MGIFTIIPNVQKRNIIGSHVRKARKASKITQRDLVAQLQVLGIKIDQAGLSRLENCNRPVTDIEIAAIAKILKVPISRLFEESSDMLSS
jgi:transcriptional regulator with XRE-family HTH domain